MEIHQSGYTAAQEYLKENLKIPNAHLFKALYLTRLLQKKQTFARYIGDSNIMTQSV